MRTLAAAMLVALGAALAGAQEPEPDRRVLALALLRARGELALAESSHARVQALHERRLASRAELDASAAVRDRARYEALERWIALAAPVPHLRIVRAVKVREADGSLAARIAVAADPAPALPPRGWLPDESGLPLDPFADQPAFVALKDEPGAAGTAIGSPYEQRLAGLRTGPREARFRLLRDVDAVVVAITVAGRTSERKVWLEGEGGDAVAIRATPFSQEGDLGAQVTYELAIERSGGDPAALRLAVLGLPDDVGREFSETTTGARVGVLRFAAGERARTVRLRVSLPPALRDSLAMDRALRFRVHLERGAETRTPAGAPPIAGSAELELVPRGVARPELRALSLYHELAIGASAELPLLVRNGGSRALDLARLVIDAPPGWITQAMPADVRALAPAAEQGVRLTIRPPPGTSLGDYEVRVRLEGASGTARFVTDPTIFRLRLRDASTWLGSASLIALLLIGGGAALVAGRRLTRR